jgi:HK97 gp10 family phage protein
VALVTLKSRIPQITAELQVKMNAVARQGAESIADGAKERVADAPPYGEGLIDAIHTESAGVGTSVIAGDQEHPYGNFLENGTVNMAAQPFLIPAAESSAPTIYAAASKVLRGI